MFCTYTKVVQNISKNTQNMFNVSKVFYFLTPYTYIYIYIKKIKLKWSRYRPGVAQRVGRRIALLFHDRGTRRGWVVSSTPRPHFTPGKDPVPILQETGWAQGPVWMGGKSHPHRDSIPDRPALSQSLYRLNYPVRHIYVHKWPQNRRRKAKLIGHILRSNLLLKHIIERRIEERVELKGRREEDVMKS